MDASAPKGSAGAAATQPDTLTTPAPAPPATAASSNPRPLGLSPSGGSGSLVPALADVSRLLDLLAGTSPELVTVEQLQAGLAGLGYLLEPSEVLELACSLGYGVEGAQGVPLSQLAASQLDWEELQVGGKRAGVRSMNCGAHVLWCGLMCVGWELIFRKGAKCGNILVVPVGLCAHCIRLAGMMWVDGVSSVAGCQLDWEEPHVGGCGILVLWFGGVWGVGQAG